MGMYDESWCAGCGTSIPYTADESAQCGECALEGVLLYIKSYRDRLQVIYDEARDGVEIPEDEYFESDAYYEGSINALEHVLLEFGAINGN